MTRWTAERMALIVKLKAEGCRVTRIAERVNALPGPPHTLCAVKARCLDLGRAMGRLSAWQPGWDERVRALRQETSDWCEITRRLEAETGARLTVRQVEKEAKRLSLRLPRNTSMSSERIEVLWRMVPAGEEWSAIVAACNALPGLPVSLSVVVNAARARDIHPPAATAREAEVADTPISLRTRDGFVSLAHVQMVRDASQADAVAVSARDAATWFAHNRQRVRIAAGTRIGLAVINEARARLGLPPFRVVRGFAVRERPPDPHLGGGDRLDYSKPRARDVA